LLPDELVNETGPNGVTMKNSLHRILTALTILLLFPVAISVVYEYVRISDSEEMITTVYKNQLESIVSSVNSYAQDVAGTWALRLEQWLKLPNDSTVLQRLVNENSSILAIYTTVDGSTNVLYESQQSESYVYDVDQILETEAGAIDQLLAYNSSNYRKFQSYPLSNGSQVLCFVGNDANEQPVICWVVIALQKFLQNHLAPRIQAIATGSFIIALRDTVRSVPLIASEMEGERSYTFDQEGDMWLFPSVKIGISLKTQTISDIARKRVKEGLILMAIVLVVLLAGSWLFTQVCGVKFYWPG
jgi:two-component system phosphate regulon sensor histidine kinase PhoR